MPTPQKGESDSERLRLPLPRLHMYGVGVGQRQTERDRHREANRERQTLREEFTHHQILNTSNGHSVGSEEWPCAISGLGFEQHRLAGVTIHSGDFPTSCS